MPGNNESYELKNHKANPHNLYVEEAFYDGRRNFWRHLRCNSSGGKALWVIIVILLVGATVGLGLGFGLAGDKSGSGSLQSNRSSTERPTIQTSTTVTASAQPPVTTQTPSIVSSATAITTTPSSNNTVITTNAGISTTDLNNNTVITTGAGISTTDLNNNTVITTEAGISTTDLNNNTVITTDAGISTTDLNNNTVITTEAGISTTDLNNDNYTTVQFSPTTSAVSTDMSSTEPGTKQTTDITERTSSTVTIVTGNSTDFTMTTRDVETSTVQHQTTPTGVPVSPSSEVIHGNFTSQQTPPPADICQDGFKNGSWERTVIFIKLTNVQESVFVRGGVPGNGTEIPILYENMNCFPVNCTGFDKYAAWSQNDTALNWLGDPEPDQGTYNNLTAIGSPLLITANVTSDNCYLPLNRYGSNYGTTSFLMNCDLTRPADGWFAFKILRRSSSWEELNGNVPECDGYNGTLSIQPRPTDHFGQCGKINIVTESSTDCKIESFPR